MKELVQKIEDTRQELINIIRSVPDQLINTAPSADSWSPSQIAEHLSKAIGTDVLYGRTGPSGRSPNEHSEEIEKMFLNFGIKMQSPEFILPSGADYKKEDILKNIEVKWDAVNKAAQSLDLNVTCLDFEFPTIGALTRLEWISFYIVHTQRHIHQLKNTLETLTDGKHG